VITGSVLTATGSAIVVPSSANNQIIFRLTNANGTGIANQPIIIDAGALGSTSASTDANGNYTYTYTAPAAAGPLDVVATAGGVSKTLTVLVQAGAGGIAPAVGPINSASVSANPSVVSTNSAATNNRTEIRALFVGPGNAAVPGCAFVSTSTATRTTSAARSRPAQAPSSTPTPAAQPPRPTSLVRSPVRPTA
jgi:hypothetical protein